MYEFCPSNHAKSTRLIWINCLKMFVPSLLLPAKLYTEWFRENLKQSVFSEVFLQTNKDNLTVLERY